LMWDWIAAFLGSFLLLSTAFYAFHYLLILIWLIFLELLSLLSIFLAYSVYKKLGWKTRLLWVFIGLILSSSIFVIDYLGNAYPIQHQEVSTFSENLFRGTYFTFNGVVTRVGAHLIAWTVIPVAVYIFFELGPILVGVALLRSSLEALRWFSPRFTQGMKWFLGEETKTKPRWEKPVEVVSPAVMTKLYKDYLRSYDQLVPLIKSMESSQSYLTTPDADKMNNIISAMERTYAKINEHKGYLSPNTLEDIKRKHSVLISLKIKLTSYNKNFVANRLKELQQFFDGAEDNVRKS